MNLSNLHNGLIGLSGYTLASITPDTAAQWVVVVITALTQIIQLFKRKKNKNENPQP